MCVCMFIPLAWKAALARRMLANFASPGLAIRLESIFSIVASAVVMRSVSPKELGEELYMVE